MLSDRINPVRQQLKYPQVSIKPKALILIPNSTLAEIIGMTGIYHGAEFMPRAPDSCPSISMCVTALG